MNEAQRQPSRAERRRSTEGRIITAARRIFADIGFERATIRSIAAAAHTDPGLVMRYFGSKEELFAQAVPMPPDEPAVDTGSEHPDGLVGALLAGLGAKLESEPVELLAMLRSIATHPEAAKDMRVAMTQQQREAADRMAGSDAMLRAGLIGALTIGVVVGRYLLELDGVRDASAAEIGGLLRPCIQSLAGAS